MQNFRFWFLLCSSFRRGDYRFQFRILWQVYNTLPHQSDLEGHVGQPSSSSGHCQRVKVAHMHERSWHSVCHCSWTFNFFYWNRAKRIHCRYCAENWRLFSGGGGGGHIYAELSYTQLTWVILPMYIYTQQPLSLKNSHFIKCLNTTAQMHW